MQRLEKFLLLDESKDEPQSKDVEVKLEEATLVSGCCGPGACSLWEGARRLGRVEQRGGREACAQAMRRGDAGCGPETEPHPLLPCLGQKGT